MKAPMVWALTVVYLLGTSVGASVVLRETGPWVAFPVFLAAATAMGVASLIGPMSRAASLAGSVMGVAETAVVRGEPVDPDVLAALVESASPFYFRRGAARVQRWASFRREAQGHG